MTEWWLVKRRHYGGGDSIVMRDPDEMKCRKYAARKNADYQCDNYYVEKWREEGDKK